MKERMVEIWGSLSTARDKPKCEKKAYEMVDKISVNIPHINIAGSIAVYRVSISIIECAVGDLGYFALTG